MRVVWENAWAFSKIELCITSPPTLQPNVPAALEERDPCNRSGRRAQRPTMRAPRQREKTIVAFTNGQTGVNNPQRQGLGSAILDGLNPLNIVDAVPPTPAGPGSTAYSPLWDVSHGDVVQCRGSGDTKSTPDFGGGGPCLAGNGTISSPSADPSEAADLLPIVQSSVLTPWVHPSHVKMAEDLSLRVALSFLTTNWGRQFADLQWMT